jgi:hypothetical protein
MIVNERIMVVVIVMMMIMIMIMKIRKVHRPPPAMPKVNAPSID